MKPILVGFLLVALGLDLVMIVFSSTRPDRKRSIFLSALTCFLFAYTLGYLLEITSATPEAAMTALKVENVGIPMIAPFFLLTVVSLFYTRRLKGWMLPAAMAYGVFMFLCVLSNDLHHLYYTSISLTPEGFALLGRGPLYFVQQAVSLALMFLAYILIIVRFARGTKSLRRQMSYFIIGSLFPFFANIINFTGALPIGLDPTPFALTVGLAFVTIDVIRHRLLDIVTVASTMAVETMDDAMVVLDGDWCFLFCNRSAGLLFPPMARFSGAEDVMRMDWWPKELAPRTEVGETTFSHVDEAGVSTVHRANISKVMLGRHTQIGWSIVIRDITETMSLMERLEELATRDPLTGVYNRRHFVDMVGAELEKAERHGLCIGLILFDLDHFKAVNDTHGHAAGDLVLRAVANAVGAQLRSYDSFARYGGEEFVICTACDSHEDLAPFAQRLCDTIASTEIRYEGTPVPITASFGVTTLQPGGSFDAAMLAADQALYQAKNTGRNRVRVSTRRLAAVRLGDPDGNATTQR